MLTTMVSGYYDANGSDVYPPGTETYGEYCYGMQEMCTQMACGYHGPPGSVRMVNGSSGPVALPLQVPPGHLVQQVVDESGALRHIIYSPPMPMPVGAHYSPSHASTMATASAYYAYAQPPYAAAAYHPQPPGHLPPAMNHQSMHSIMQPPSPQCNGQSQTGASPPPSHIAPAQKDDRYQRQTYKFRRKLESRSKECNKMVILSNQSSSVPSKKDRRKLKYDDGIRLNGGSSGSNASEDEEVTMILSEYLSSMRPPTVTDVTSRSAVVCWKPPEISPDELEKKLGLNPEQSEITYEVMLCEKDKDLLMKSVYSGSGYHCTITGLKPSTEYYVYIQASLDDVRGRSVEGSVFKSQGPEAEVPQPPRLCARTKNSLTLKWNNNGDLSTKIKNYVLEYDEGFGGHNFIAVYSGTAKQYKVTKLLPATCYRFRLCVEYEKGKRMCSSESAFFTCGNAPSQPLPPVLKQAYINRLHLEWEKRPCDNDFSLLFKDEHMHGFLTAYNGRETSYVCTGLSGNTEYKFQLCARNEEGHSPWSKTVTYSTLPDKLSCRPGKPMPKGRIHASCFRVTWDAPKENKMSSITKYKLEVDRGCGFEAVYTGPNTEFFLDNLLPGTLYKLKVACISSTGCISYSDVNSITTAAVHPGKCAAPRLQCKPESSFLCLEWAHPVDDGGSSVSEYEVAMTSPDNITLQAYKGSETTCVVSDLLPGRPYLFQVRAWNRIGAGDWSDSLEVVSGAGPPDAPRNFTVESCTPHSCFLSWDEPVNNGATITSYQLQMNLEESSEEEESFSELYEGLSCVYEVKGLMPATLYFFRVRAVNDAGPGMHSDIVSCKTPASVPGVVSSVSITTTSTSLSLSWKEPTNNGSEITSYNVELDDYLYNTETNITELCIEGLSPATLYRVRVQALNSMGEGPFSSPVEGITLKSPPDPPQLECILTAHNNLRLKWGEGKNTDLIIYTLEMSSKTKSFVPIYHGLGLNFKVNRLQENMAYHFRICASSDSGQGPYSELYTFCTTRAPPPSLKAPKVTNVTESSCFVEWMSTKQYSGYTYSYQLQLAVEGISNAKVVYHGPEVKCHLTNLDPQTHYLVRVAAIRHYQDEDLIGAYSPTTAFTTSPSDAVNSPLSAVAPQTSSISFSERRTFRDRQLAALMSAAFLLFSFLFTMVLEHFFNFSRFS